MITCSHCGYQTPEGAVRCLKCGSPFPEQFAGGGQQASPMSQQLPAWLESLRAGERAAAPASSNPGSFSAADLLEEGSLPSWMRADREDTGGSGPQSSIRPSAFPSPQTDERAETPYALQAHSLIDENALPSWMKEGQAEAKQPPTQQESFSEKGFSASQLVSQEAIPAWMRQLQESHLGGNMSPTPQPTPSSQAVPSAPAFNQQAPTAFPPQQPVVPVPVPQEGNLNPSTGFNARDLVDEQALPSWITQQQSQASQASVPGQSPKDPSAKLSLSSLIDEQELPSWMQEANLSSSNRTPLAPQFSNQQPQAPAWQQPPQQATPQAPLGMNPELSSGGVSASSFIDMEALPEWLRHQGGSVPGVQQNPVYGGSGIQPAPVQMSVPSRPRSEIQAQESSEVAANVFASMLGVSSNAPQFPQQGGPVQQQQQQAAPFAQQPNMNYAQQQPQHMGYQQQSGSRGLPPLDMPPPPARAPQSMIGVPQPGPGNNNYSSHPYATNQPSQASYQGNPMNSGRLVSSNEQKSNKKKGIFESLRDWLFR